MLLSVTDVNFLLHLPISFEFWENPLLLFNRRYIIEKSFKRKELFILTFVKHDKALEFYNESLNIKNYHLSIHILQLHLIILEMFMRVR